MRFASAFCVVAAMGCSDDHSHSASPSDPCSDGGAYERVGVTDEACRAFVEAESRGEVVVDTTKAPAWTAPSGKVPSSPPPRFAWTKGTLARAPWRRFLKAINPIGEAWAHGDTTGDAFVLTFTSTGGTELHRVMTINLEYTPTAAVWDKIRAGVRFNVTVTGVRFTRNTIASGTKPTAGSPLNVWAE